jgi:hypothetical protein
MASDLIPTLFASGAVALALAAVALFNVFPDLKLLGLVLATLAGAFFFASRFGARSKVGRALWLYTPLDFPILLLLIQIGVTSWATALPENTWIAVGQLAAGLVAYYVVVNWSRDGARLRWSVVALILLGLGLALVAPFAVDWFREQKTFLPSTVYRFFPLLLPDSIHPNVMAAALATLMPIPLALSINLPVVKRRHLWLRGALAVVYMIEALVLILTKSRGGYIALFIGLWVTLWLSDRRRWAIGLSIVAALLILWFALATPSDTGDGLDPAQAALDASTWAFRQRVWQTALEIIADFPFTGVGAGTFNDVAGLFYGFHSPSNPGTHNLFLHAGVDLGLVGLITYLASLLIVLWGGTQAYLSFDTSQERLLRAVTIGGLSGIVSTLANGLVNSHTWGSKGAFIPWMIMGLVIALYSLALSSGVYGLECKAFTGPR